MKRLLLSTLAFWSVQNPTSAQTTSEAYWNFSGGATASVSPPNADLTLSALVSGNNLGSTPTLVTSTSPSSGYTFTQGGISGTAASGGSNAGAAAKTGAFAEMTSTFFEITFTPAAGKTVSISSVNFGSRSTGTAPQAYTVSTNVGGFATPVATGTLANTSSWTYRSNTFTNEVVGAAGSAVTLRIYGHNGTGSPGAGTTNWRMDDLVITATTSASGQPACVAPATSATALTFPSTTTTSINGSFAPASSGADGYVIFAAPAATTTAPAVADGTTYSGSNAPAGYTFISSGSGTTFSATGLTSGTTYNFFVFAFNNASCSGGPAYNTTVLTGNASTQSVPACTAPATASNVTVAPSFNTASGTFSAPSPGADSFLIFYGFGTTPPPALSNGTSYGVSNTPATYGFVDKQDGSSTSFSIAGLTPSTQYTVYVFAYNATGCSGGPVYSPAAGSTFTTTPVTIATYTWNVANGQWSSPSSWTPSRTSPATTDVLLFDGSVQPSPSVIVDFVSAESISQLKFQNGVSAIFQTAANRILNIGDGAAGEDLLLPVGNKLTIQSTANSLGLTLSVGTGNTGLIADSVKLAGNSATGQAHRMLAADVSGIDVLSTGVIEQGVNFSGTAFGTSGNANAIEFLSGSTLIVRSGTNIFGLGAPNSRALYDPASNVYFANGGNLSPAGSGRTYPNLYIVNNTAVTMSGGSNFTVGNLFVEAGSRLEFNGSGTNVITVNGDILADGPVDLDAGSQVVFSSPNPVIGGTESVIIRDAVNLPSLTASSDSLVFVNGLTITGTLTLNSGRIVTGSGILTLGTSPAAPGMLVYSGGVIDGTFKRYFGAATNGGNTGLFPMGRPRTAERRLATVEFMTAPTSGGSLTAFVDSASLNTISATVVTDGTCPSGFSVSTLAGQYLTISAGDGLSGGAYDLTLQYQDPGAVNNLCELAVAKRADENGVWTIDGIQDFGAGTLAEPIVRHTGLTSFSDFIIAGSPANPLPLGLTSFQAAVRSRSVHLSWSLSDAADVERITVERSADGRTFAPIGTAQVVGAPGTFVDEIPAAGNNFYRLRLTGALGREALSAVRSVTIPGTASADILIYPNPASDVLYLRGSESLSAQLYDVTGRVVRTIVDAGPDVEISLLGVPAGIYLLHAVSGATTVREHVRIGQ